MTENRLKWVGLTNGVIALILTYGFYSQHEAFINLWMWPDGRLTYIFLASMTAAIAAPILWISLTKEWKAAVGGGINLSIQALGVFVFLLILSLNGTGYWGHVIVFALFCVLSFVVYRWMSRFSWRDTRPTPRLVRISFVVFAITLTLATIALVLGVPNIFPWPLKRETSTMIGLMFSGNVLYFLYGVMTPYWGNAVGQLLGFLAYDLILIFPFIGHFSSVHPEHRASLIIYTGVLVYSGGLAIYYLFFHPTLALWRPVKTIK